MSNENSPTVKHEMIIHLPFKCLQSFPELNKTAAMRVQLLALLLSMMTWTIFLTVAEYKIRSKMHCGSIFKLRDTLAPVPGNISCGLDCAIFLLQVCVNFGKLLNGLLHPFTLLRRLYSIRQLLLYMYK
jgi:hypothetical protein